MLYIADDIIYITHGDDGNFNVTIKDEQGIEYIMEAGDTLIFTVRELPDITSPVLFQTTSDNNFITINAADMKNIPAGKYSCDVQLNSRFGKIHTVYPLLDIHGRTRNFKNFIVDPEVTYD